MIAVSNAADGFEIINDDGAFPVVTALGGEDVSLVVDRISALGGSANVVLERDDGTVDYIAVKNTRLNDRDLALQEDDDFWQNIYESYFVEYGSSDDDHKVE
jgi:hypothetical protein